MSSWVTKKVPFCWSPSCLYSVLPFLVVPLLMLICLQTQRKSLFPFHRINLSSCEPPCQHSPSVSEHNPMRLQQFVQSSFKSQGTTVLNAMAFPTWNFRKTQVALNGWGIGWCHWIGIVHGLHTHPLNGLSKPTLEVEPFTHSLECGETNPINRRRTRSNPSRAGNCSKNLPEICRDPIRGWRPREILGDTIPEINPED